MALVRYAAVELRTRKHVPWVKACEHAYEYVSMAPGRFTLPDQRQAVMVGVGRVVPWECRSPVSNRLDLVESDRCRRANEGKHGHSESRARVDWGIVQSI